MRSPTSTDPNPFNARALAVLGWLTAGAAWAGPSAPTAPLAPGATPAPAAQALDTGKRGEVSSRKPVDISSDQLSFDRLGGQTLFTGDVKVLHDQLTLTSDQLETTEGNRQASATGNVRVDDLKSGLHLTCGNLDYADLMDRITAHDHPQLTTVDGNGVPVTLRARQLELDSDVKRVTAHQDVEIFRDDSRSEAQLATFDSKTDQLVLEENPRIFMPQGVIGGRRITTSLSGDHRIVVEGMAEAEFYVQPKPVPTKPPGAGSSTPLGITPGAAPTPGSASPAVRPAAPPTPTAPGGIRPPVPVPPPGAPLPGAS
ncbi:MAG TPA: LptA/OstA family protein [bacterium]|nr:LptA/OstA family protein [bacterium]